MPAAPPPHALLLGALLAAGALAPGCAKSSRPSTVPLAAMRPYEGPDRQNFDDSIDPAVLGLTFYPSDYRRDQRFFARAQTAHGVARMRIVTISVDSSREGSPYRLQLRRVGEPLKHYDEAEAVEVEVRPGSPSYSLCRQYEAKLSNRTGLAMWKRFRQHDEPSTHFYLAPDNDEAVAAAREALALQEVSGQ
ncbi:MAG TPA: hypothetical protein VFS43_25955 [Polyangiaceae bacterium]|nr:hypothetical protein [Polyangiaceae bacterium]